ncbi:hypothetical protein [Enterobacter hormaechei]|uniref:hypothetical protein n=2 Tax=Enterobacter hormaechei TaxID=158836 RepID=UPI00188810C8|nr:hypothetical protein [Enterobacter hormaechei]MBF1961979.1 hypothetical protein [Enterobacter hormaechei]MBF1979497.1 hypothetical protein [Enterobacter hormaechei]
MVATVYISGCCIALTLVKVSFQPVSGGTLAHPVQERWLITSCEGNKMSHLKINSINNINFAVEANTFKLTVGIVGPNNSYHSVELEIDPKEIKNKTISELEQLALQKLRT